MRLGRMEEGSYHGSLAGLTHGGGKLVRMDANVDADHEHLSYRRKVAFTGTLLSMRRQDAWDAVSRCGAGQSRHGDHPTCPYRPSLSTRVRRSPLTCPASSAPLCSNL